eukprot:4603198-Pleurochrysis_carterae.AAC.2
MRTRRQRRRGRALARLFPARLALGSQLTNPSPSISLGKPSCFLTNSKNGHTWIEAPKFLFEE